MVRYPIRLTWMGVLATLSCSLQDFDYLQLTQSNSSTGGVARLEDASGPEDGTLGGAGTSRGGGDGGRAGTNGSLGGVNVGGAGSSRGVGGTESLDGSRNQGGTEGGTALDGGRGGADAEPAEASCDLCTARAALVHRYTFSGVGTRIDDSVGQADGTLFNTTLSNTGRLVLAGGTAGQYVALPGGILSSLNDATLESWITWNGASTSERILDFGDLSEGGATGRTYVALTPSFGGTNKLHGQFYNTSVDLTVEGPSALPSGQQCQVALVLSQADHVMSLYQNGELVAQASGIQALHTINDVDNWLGRSKFAGNRYFGGTLHAFRIYGTALSAAQIKASYTAGAD
jgi:hypothetical protein